MLVFAGGIGENAPEVPARICDGLGFIVIDLKPEENAANAAVISSTVSRVILGVIGTDEEWIIAKMVCRVFRLSHANQLNYENEKGLKGTLS